jgi:hypothetical protein
MVSTYYMDNVTYIGKSPIKHTIGQFNNNKRVFSTSIIVLLMFIILGLLGYIVYYELNILYTNDKYCYVGKYKNKPTCITHNNEKCISNNSYSSLKNCLEVPVTR